MDPIPYTTPPKKQKKFYIRAADLEEYGSKTKTHTDQRRIRAEKLLDNIRWRVRNPIREKGNTSTGNGLTTTERQQTVVEESMRLLPRREPLTGIAPTEIDSNESSMDVDNPHIEIRIEPQKWKSGNQ